MNRHTVRKIQPALTASFDQQFWPVLVSITVLSGIALGAVLTILRGPWMWGSLLVLPLLAALAVLLLFHLDDKRMRRSFQLAIILSLAVHLLVLVFASVTSIFQNPYEVPERKVAQKKIRTIEISDQRASFVWEQTNSRETPEPEVEPERSEQPTTTARPQPVPVDEAQPEVAPQLVRRPTPQATVPKQNRSLSQLRRQTDQAQPRSSQPAAASQPSPAAAAARQPAPIQPSENQAANQVARSSEAASAPAAAAAAEQPLEAPAEPLAAAARKVRQAENSQIASPSPSPSSARLRREESQRPQTTENLAQTESPAPAASSAAPAAQPSPSAGEIARGQAASEAPSVARQNTPTQLSPSNQTATASERRSTSSTRPTISNPASTATQPRRATTEAAVAVSPTPLENPARSPESPSNAREVSSRTLAVSRSTSGIVGAGRSSNLDRFVGGAPSPATRASAAARRERSLNQPTTTPMLTSSEAARTRRSQGAAPVPSNVLPADTSAPAKLAGSRQPSQQTLESSAAEISSASSSHRDEISAEMGAATVDLGPTKVVSEQLSQRRSGGGQPEVSRLNPDQTRRSRDPSNQRPTLAAAVGEEAAAPRGLSAAPVADDALAPADTAVVAQRQGGQAARTTERAAAAEAGDPAPPAAASLAEDLAQARERSTGSASGGTERGAPESRQANPDGDSRSRIAQAPVTRRDPGFGIAPAEGAANAPAAGEGDEVELAAESQLQRRATSTRPGQGLQRSGEAERLLAANGRPANMRQASPRRPSPLGQSTEGDNPNLASRDDSSGRSNAARPTIAPLQAAEADAGAPNAATPSSEPGQQLAARAVGLERSTVAEPQSQPGAELKVMAPEGPAGLGDQPDDLIGVLARPASRQSDQVMPDLNSRFRNREFGGTPAINPDAVLAQEAFRNRTPSTMARMSEPTTEAAIQLGLEFLARNQSPDGSWSLTGFDREAPQAMTQLDSDTAATGLAILAFQGAGYNHREYRYARQLKDALDWLIEMQAEDGGLYVSSDPKSDAACRMYSHGIATLALTEAYGMTQDPRLKEPAQRALDYIRNSQDPRKGGWRYYQEAGKRSTDTSVSGWMMMALQSGRLAGLNVRQATFDGIDNWLEVAADPDDPSRYRYNPYLVDSRGVSRIQGRQVSTSMTSVALLMRIYGGWDKEDPRLLAGVDYLLDNQLPSDATPQLRDTYYWYYATQVIRHVGGERWERWNDRLRPLLTDSQEKTGDMAGSWHPYRPVPDRWGAFGGRIYVTTMNLLSLEVRHRLLPLYQQDREFPELMGIIERQALSDLPSAIAARSNPPEVSWPPLKAATPPAWQPPAGLDPLPRQLPRDRRRDVVSGELAAGPRPLTRPGPRRAEADLPQPSPRELPAVLLADRRQYRVALLRPTYDLPTSPLSLPARKPASWRTAEVAGAPLALRSPEASLLTWTMAAPAIPATTPAAAADGLPGPVEDDRVHALATGLPGWPGRSEPPALPLPRTARAEPLASHREPPRAALAMPGLEFLSRSWGGLPRRRETSAWIAAGASSSGGAGVASGATWLLPAPDRPRLLSSVTRWGRELAQAVARIDILRPVTPDRGLPRMFGEASSTPLVPAGAGDRPLEVPPRVAAATPAGRPVILDSLPLVRRWNPGARFPRLAAVAWKRPTPEPPPVRYGHLQGQVTLDGEPLAEADIAILPLSGDQPVRRLRTDAQGKFLVPARSESSPETTGLPTGTYRVAITTYRESPDINQIDLLERVPARYNTETELRLTVEPGENAPVTWSLERR